MKKTVGILIAFLVIYSFYQVVFMGLDRPPEWSEALTELHEGEFDETIRTAPPWMVVHVWATWCSICKQAKPDYNVVAERFPDNVGFYHLDLDQNPEWAETYRVSDGVPTTLIFYQGQEISRHSGRLPAGAMENWIHHTTGVHPLPDS